MTDFIDTKREEIKARMAEIEPLIGEYKRLRVADLALEGAAGSRRASRRGRPRGGGSREGRALELLRAGSLTVSELGEAMGMRPNYLYRLMPRLEGEGKVRKVDGRYELAT